MAVELYVTSTPSTAVQRTEISRLAQLLDVKKVAYTTVDLATDRDARDRMTTASGGVAILPQLHVGGKFVGTFQDVQEMEDFGELDAALTPKK